MIDSAVTLLPLPRLAHDAEDFALGQAERDAVDGVDRAAAEVEFSFEVFDFQQGFGHVRPKAAAGFGRPGN